MRPEFVFDERLGIHLPELKLPWDEYPLEVRREIVKEWEMIRGRIPERVKELEAVIMARQGRLDREDNFTESCRLNWEIAELASTINDLHIWYRVNQDISERIAHH